jgi:hypothetical protein
MGAVTIRAEDQMLAVFGEHRKTVEAIGVRDAF